MDDEEELASDGRSRHEELEDFALPHRSQSISSRLGVVPAGGCVLGANTGADLSMWHMAGVGTAPLPHPCWICRRARPTTALTSLPPPSRPDPRGRWPQARPPPHAPVDHLDPSAWPEMAGGHCRPAASTSRSAAYKIYAHACPN